MEKEHIYMAVGEPENSVILKYIRGTASEEEKAEVNIWQEETSGKREGSITNCPHLLCLPNTRADCFSRSFKGVLGSG